MKGFFFFFTWLEHKWRLNRQKRQGTFIQEVWELQEELSNQKQDSQTTTKSPSASLPTTKQAFQLSPNLRQNQWYAVLQIL